ncbi:hypothetical protein BH09MYX1_BH09MYX1_25750 [soil metagenome]
MPLGSCRLCGLDQLLPLFIISDNEGRPTEIRICLRCFVLIPEYTQSTAVPAAEMTDHQAQFHDAQWSETSEAEAATLRAELRELITFYGDLIGEPSSDVQFDVGAGRGALIAALRDAGYDARGCEPSAPLAERARAAFGLTSDQLVSGNAAQLFDRIRQERLPVGHFFLWHVIEHVADPLALMRQIATVLPVGHCVFVQAPCLKEPWLYPEHLILLTEPAVHAIARNCGCEVASLNYDHKLAFVTFVLRRLDRPIADTWVSTPTFGLDHLAALEVELPRVKKQLQESQAHASVMVAMADERLRGIEGQAKMIVDRDKWIAELLETAGWRNGELDHLRRTVADGEATLLRTETEKTDLERTIDELSTRLEHHENRTISARVGKMFAKVWSRKSG